MGAAGSRDESDCVGYRVLGVQPNSPAGAVGLVSFFDFIVAANGVPLRTLDNTFIELIKSSQDKQLPLTVYNYKSQTVRDVAIVPTRRWGGQGMLGVTIRFDSYHNADENLVRVLAVSTGGPAQIAGLRPETDYLLGTAEKVFKDPEVLQAELLAHLEQPMEFYVYNTETDEVRVVVILPTLAWGGKGCLGAEVGHGILHTLPQHCRGSTATSVGAGITLPVRDATGDGGGGLSPGDGGGSGGGGVGGAAARGSASLPDDRRTGGAGAARTVEAAGAAGTVASAAATTGGGDAGEGSFDVVDLAELRGDKPRD